MSKKNIYFYETPKSENQEDNSHPLKALAFAIASGIVEKRITFDKAGGSFNKLFKSFEFGTDFLNKIKFTELSSYLKRPTNYSQLNHKKRNIQALAEIIYEEVSNANMTDEKFCEQISEKIGVKIEFFSIPNEAETIGNESTSHHPQTPSTPVKSTSKISQEAETLFSVTQATEGKLTELLETKKPDLIIVKRVEQGQPEYYTYKGEYDDQCPSRPNKEYPTPQKLDFGGDELSGSPNDSLSSSSYNSSKSSTHSPERDQTMPSTPNKASVMLEDKFTQCSGVTLSGYISAIDGHVVPVQGGNSGKFFRSVAAALLMRFEVDIDSYNDLLVKLIPEIKEVIGSKKAWKKEFKDKSFIGLSSTSKKQFSAFLKDASLNIELVLDIIAQALQQGSQKVGALDQANGPVANSILQLPAYLSIPLRVVSVDKEKNTFVRRDIRTKKRGDNDAFKNPDKTAIELLEFHNDNDRELSYCLLERTETLNELAKKIDNVMLKYCREPGADILNLYKSYGNTLGIDFKNENFLEPTIPKTSESEKERNVSTTESTSQEETLSWSEYQPPSKIPSPFKTPEKKESGEEEKKESGKESDKKKDTQLAQQLPGVLNLFPSESGSSVYDSKQIKATYTPDINSKNNIALLNDEEAGQLISDTGLERRVVDNVSFTAKWDLKTHAKSATADLTNFLDASSDENEKNIVGIVTLLSEILFMKNMGAGQYVLKATGYGRSSALAAGYFFAREIGIRDDQIKFANPLFTARKGQYYLSYQQFLSDDSKVEKDLTKLTFDQKKEEESAFSVVKNYIQNSGVVLDALKNIQFHDPNEMKKESSDTLTSNSIHRFFTNANNVSSSSSSSPSSSSFKKN